MSWFDKEKMPKLKTKSWQEKVKFYKASAAKYDALAEKATNRADEKKYREAAQWHRWIANNWETNKGVSGKK